MQENQRLERVVGLGLARAKLQVEVIRVRKLGGLISLALKVVRLRFVADSPKGDFITPLASLFRYLVISLIRMLQFNIVIIIL